MNRPNTSSCDGGATKPQFMGPVVYTFLSIQNAERGESVFLQVPLRKPIANFPSSSVDLQGWERGK
jgi:hypothetical protein